MTKELTDVVIRDVTLRDGLQDEAPIPTSAKLEIFEALVSAGVTELEVASFVRPDRVPAMADAEAMCAATEGYDVVRWGLVLNEKGAERALEAGLTHLQYVISVSETHSQGNAGRSTDEAIEDLSKVCSLAGDRAQVELTLATAFGCPHEGPIPLDRVVELAAAGSVAGAGLINLADTIGTALPREISAAVINVRLGTRAEFGVHLHDTRGMGIMNAVAALEVGVAKIDGSVGALGGCPFAPGATGNLALEDLIHFFDATEVRTGVSVTGLITAAEKACSAVGRPVGSRVGVAGPRFAKTQDS